MLTIKNSSKLTKKISALTMAALIVMEQFAYFPQVSVSADKTASDSGAVNFPSAISGNEESAILSHNDQLVDNGNGTYTFTSELMSSYSYFDESKGRLYSQDGSYTLDKAGTYLVELWGGDGGDGSSFFPLSFKAGSGGKGGFVYGLLKIEEDDVGKKLYYEIGSRGLSETRSITGGGTGGIGGGAGDIAVFSVGAGGGYSAMYLMDETDNEISDEIRNNPNKVLMIAGGGGGGGAGAALHTLPGLFGGDGKANGGDGGTLESVIWGKPNIGAFVPTNPKVGTYYAGKNGSTSGTKGAYVGKGGTDIPGEIVNSFIGFLEASSYPNDWQKTYHPELDRGVGGASNFRGGGGGAGFAGGSGGMQNEPLDARNVGGGGGGSSYVSKILNFEAGAIGDANYFVERDGNTNSDTGGAVVIRYLSGSDEGTDYSYLNNIRVSGEISPYFDIVSTNCSNSGNSFTANGSVAPVSTGLAKGQEKDKLTFSITIKPKAEFFGGNKVPIFNENGATLNVTGGGKTTTITLGDDVKYVNVPYDLSIKTLRTIAHEGDVITKGDLFTGDKAYAANDPMMDFISGISYSVYGTDVDDFTYTILESDVENGGKSFNVSAEITPKSGLTPAVVGSAGSPTITKTAYVQCVSENMLEIDGFMAQVEKSLSYNETDETYDLKVNAKIESGNDTTKTFSINEAVSSEQVLDIVYNNTNLGRSNEYVTITRNGSNTKYTGTLEPGIYYVEVWGGDGGDGNNAQQNLSSIPSGDHDYGGLGGKGGYINGYVVINEQKQLDITLGEKGSAGTSDSVAGKGGKASYVYIKNANSSSTESTLIAGGGGGGTPYVAIGATDQNYHMGYPGNDGYREGGSSAFLGIAGETGYGNPSSIPYYSSNTYNGSDGKGVSISWARHQLNDYDSGIAGNFANGGFSTTSGEVKTIEGLADYDRFFVSNSSEDVPITQLKDESRYVTVDRGLYEYSYRISGLLSGYYVSQWTNDNNGDLTDGGSDNKFKRISNYIGTTKNATELKNQKNGAVRITRLGVYGGSIYNGTATPNETAEDVVAKIKADYANANCYTDFTINSEFTKYFALQSDSSYSITNNTETQTGTHTFALSAANVQSIATIPDDTDSSSLPGYTLVKHNYEYGLRGTGSVTFKLKPINGFLGGNDVPLLEEATITHQYTTSEIDDDTVHIPTVDDPTVDYANVALAGETLEDTVSTEPVFIDYNTTLTADKLSGNITAYPPDKENDLCDDFADYSAVAYDDKVGQNITEDTDCFVTAELKATSAAEKANVIGAVDKVSRNFKVPVYVSYPIETQLTHLTSNVATKFPTAVDDTELVFEITAEKGYDLPAEDDVEITNTDLTDPNAVPTAMENAVVEKIDDKITVRIPRSSITGKVTVKASGVDSRHNVKYYYEVYDPVSTMISLEEAVDSKKFANGDKIEGITYPALPDKYPNGYDGYFWDWSIETDTNGDHIMGQEDVIIVGTYKPITYGINVRYYTTDEYSNTVILGEYTSPFDRTKYENGTYHIALIKGTEYYVASPEFDGYVTNMPYVSGRVDDAFINDLTETRLDDNGKEHLVKVVDVRYTKVSEDTELIVNFVKCDVRGAPTGEASGITTITGGQNYNYSNIADVINSKIPSANELVKITKVTSDTDGTDVATTESQVDTITEAGTYNVYYREKPQTVTIRLFKNSGDPEPAATRKAVIGREYSYDPDNDDYIPLPTVVDSTHEYRHTGWKTESGDIIEDDTIVSGSAGDVIKLCAVWESTDITITVRYLFAMNVSDVEKRGTAAAAQIAKTMTYGKSYTFNAAEVPNYTAEPQQITGVALADKTETFYYIDAENPNKSITIKANIYSIYYKDSDSGKAADGAPLLKGGTFALYAQDGTLIGTKQNTSGVVSWNNTEFDIRQDMTYTIKCTAPPIGYGAGEAVVTVGTSDTDIVIDDIEIFLDVTPFELPFAGSTPMTGYTVFGLSTMVLAVFLLFVHMRSKTEEEKIKERIRRV
ncbi:hypothetical protein RASY3_05895 [Ruminococcus albus SY3]|uniref:receptor protein-tyrosine kinase n=1 Tax=Ruminococcus albus SY3 TaxID=1341156 RepID=A0A011VZZ3_RUMAL|nr:glycine-rich protein [Ruminococcus albus]EXM40113.1 hypothetical protein RASY3_05895 [Ruminococcus albus SY3]